MGLASREAVHRTVRGARLGDVSENGNELELLLVEDDPADTTLLIQQLDRADVCSFGLRVASSIADAEVRITNEDVDCVLLDLALPDSDGIASVERIHRIDPDVPIIVLTGRDESALALDAIEAGAQDFLVKGVVRGNSILRCARWAVARMRAAGVVAPHGERWVLREDPTGPEQAILDLADVPAVYLDGEMAIRFANPAFERLVGFSEADLAGVAFTDLLVSDDLIGVVLEIRALLKVEEVSRLVDVSLQNRGGGSTTCRMAVARVVEDGSLSLLLVVLSHEPS
jgi:PAS domain S-box-containing protein